MDRKVKKKQKSLGFTIIELVVLLAIVSILSVVVLKEIYSYLEKARLRQALNQFLSDLNYVKTQAQITGSAWGIRACTGSESYKIFIDHDGNCRDISPNCNVANSTKVCLNNPTQVCASDADCFPSSAGSCKPLEQVKTLNSGYKFAKGNLTNHFYVVFDRKGLPFDYSCGVGPDNVTIKSPTNKEKFSVFVDRFGRVRVE